MENNFNQELYKRAQKIITKRKNFILFFWGYIIITIVLKLIDFNQLNYGFNNTQRDFFILIQGIILIFYGIYLFVPYFHNWEERKTKELMEKYNQKN